MFQEMVYPSKTANCTECGRKSTCFHSLESNDLQIVEDSRVELRFRTGETICKQGAFASQITYLHSGLVKIYLETGNETDLILNVISAGQLIGLPSLYNNKVCQYTAVAIEDSIVCSIDIKVFDKYIRSNGDFAAEIIYELNRNTSISYARFLALTQKNLHGRIAESLLYLSDEVFKKDEFVNSLSRKDMAELAGTSCESVTRVLSSFKSDGIIEMEGKSVKLSNKTKLRQISEHG